MLGVGVVGVVGVGVDVVLEGVGVLLDFGVAVVLLLLDSFFVVVDFLLELLLEVDGLLEVLTAQGRPAIR